MDWTTGNDESMKAESTVPRRSAFTDGATGWSVRAYFKRRDGATDGLVFSGVAGVAGILMKWRFPESWRYPRIDGVYSGNYHRSKWMMTRGTPMTQETTLYNIYEIWIMKANILRT